MPAILKVITRGAVAASLAVTLGLTLPMGAIAQPKPVGGVGMSESIVEKVKVKAIDLPNRRVTVTNGANQTYSMKVSPDVKNLDKLKVGDSITATYFAEAGLYVSPPGGTLPKDVEKTIAARAAKGELPAGAVGSYTSVSGAILGIDMAKHTLKVVSTKGGMVHTIAVKDAQNQQAMSKLKVGDTVTAFVTDTLMVAATPG